MKILLGIAFIILSAASCNTTSLQPIATLDKMVTDDRVAGEWNGPKGNFLVEPLKKVRCTPNCRNPFFAGN
ncbi:hypothetical protein MKQ70_10640 [Chitinophaga sedimenti]|uniref:hypothetical protein n=1 Tax=Chitinophaga sedimenti TaxID=2033606 RepID=UPI002006BBBB|nr:hypothetical protein [Chitinophaga sedimenti]MCK7555438.1 hypothetical protein [Chitinophaga sedimenti]